jgi:uncharacterized protein YndB with AHSA1/START domain
MSEPGAADERTNDLSVEVPGSPEEVWEAIATGPGISSWFVPHEFAATEGAPVRADFGSGFFDAGSVAAWEPPHRLVMRGDGDQTLAFEWLVEAADGGGCVVRLVCTGFGSGEDWDAQYHGMAEGWQLFLANLRLHLTHFRGQHARSIIPSGVVQGTRDSAFESLCTTLGVSADLRVGDTIDVTAAGAPRISGQVAAAASIRGARAYHLWA